MILCNIRMNLVKMILDKQFTNVDSLKNFETIRRVVLDSIDINMVNQVKPPHIKISPKEFAELAYETSIGIFGKSKSEHILSQINRTKIDPRIDYGKYTVRTESITLSTDEELEFIPISIHEQTHSLMQYSLKHFIVPQSEFPAMFADKVAANHIQKLFPTSNIEKYQNNLRLAKGTYPYFKAFKTIDQPMTNDEFNDFLIDLSHFKGDIESTLLFEEYKKDRIGVIKDFRNMINGYLSEKELKEKYTLSFENNTIIDVTTNKVKQLKNDYARKDMATWLRNLSSKR